MTSLSSLPLNWRSRLSLELHSETYHHDGGAGGDAIRRTLGRPHLDGLSLLLREAVQNAWDARLPARGRSGAQVVFTARLGQFSEAELASLAHEVFAERPKDPAHPLTGVLRPGIKRLILEDRGTVGLGGPVFMIPRRSPEQADNFIRFFRLVGRAGAGRRSGGSYGFGKSVFFNASRGATVVVHSRFLKPNGTPSERLMAMSLWNPSHSHHHLTGRHWWGVTDARHRPSVGPLAEGKAAALARKLGFAGFSSTETGTSIMILAPQFGSPLDEDPGLTANCIAETLVLWHWPRMLGGADRQGKIVFRVFLGDQPVAVPDPERTPPLDLYAASLRHIVARHRKDAAPESPGAVQEIASERPRARLGWLALRSGTRAPQQVWQSVQSIENHPLRDQLNSRDGVVEPVTRHVALLRSPGQVIRYLPVRPFLDGRRQYAGVFLLDTDPPEIEDEFIDAEPPSHDDWIPEDRGRNARNVVRIALRRIREATDGFVSASKPVADTQVQDPLGVLSAALGQLLSPRGATTEFMNAAGNLNGLGTGGTTGVVRASPDGSAGTVGGSNGSNSNVIGPANRLPAIRLLGGGQLVQGNGGAELHVRFRIDGSIPNDGVLRAFPRIIVAGGQTERDAPNGGAVAQILGWRDPAGQERPGADSVLIGRGAGGEWLLRVSVPSDAMVGVAVSIAAAKAPADP